MSAFCVPLAHINALVSWASRNPTRFWSFDPHTAGQLLLDANNASVRARYRDADTAGMIVAERFTFDPFADHRAPRLPLNAVEVLKACDCLEYQSCEVDEWERTPAARLLDSIRAAAISALPGYDAAPWVLNGQAVSRA